MNVKFRFYNLARREGKPPTRIACEECRQRHIACDELPVCTQCTKRNLPCSRRGSMKRSFSFVDCTQNIRSMYGFSADTLAVEIIPENEAEESVETENPSKIRKISFDRIVQKNDLTAPGSRIADGSITTKTVPKNVPPIELARKAFSPPVGLTEGSTCISKLEVSYLRKEKTSEHSSEAFSPIVEKDLTYQHHRQHHHHPSHFHHRRNYHHTYHVYDQHQNDNYHYYNDKHQYNHQYHYDNHDNNNDNHRYQHDKQTLLNTQLILQPILPPIQPLQVLLLPPR